MRSLYTRDYVHRLYVSRKEERRGLASIQDSVDASIQQREGNIKERRARLKNDYVDQKQYKL